MFTGLVADLGTVAALDRDGDGEFTADVMNQTLSLTSLGPLGEGDRVNLELALRASDRMGGHVVQGHVDAVGRVRSVTPEADGRRVWVDAPEAVVRVCIEKGSIAVALIPHTLAVTTLGALAPGDPVNVEVDVLAKYVERLTATTMPG